MRKCVWRQPGLLHDAKYHAGRFIKSRDFYCSLNHVISRNHDPFKGYPLYHAGRFIKSRDFYCSLNHGKSLFVK
jgi:hypothetical protein